MAIQPYQMNGYQEEVRTPFFHLNKIVTPVRIATFNPTGGEKQPTIRKNFLQTENVGKSPNTVPALDVYVGNSLNIGG